MLECSQHFKSQYSKLTTTDSIENYPRQPQQPLKNASTITLKWVRWEEWKLLQIYSTSKKRFEDFAIFMMDKKLLLLEWNMHWQEMMVLLEHIEFMVLLWPEEILLTEFLLKWCKRPQVQVMVREVQCIITTQSLTSTVETVSLEPSVLLAQVLLLEWNTKRRRTFVSLCTEMVQPIKVSFMKLQIWLVFGNFHVCSCAKITNTPWVLLLKELHTILSFSREEI